MDAGNVRSYKYLYRDVWGIKCVVVLRGLVKGGE